MGLVVPAARQWRARFEAEGLAKFGEVRKGRGRKPEIPQAKVDEIVRLALCSKPEGHTHWSCQTTSKATGVSAATVQRVWHARGLKPHLVETFKLSNDEALRREEHRRREGLLDPPDKAIVLCLDEKSQNPGLQTAPSRPCRDEEGQGGHRDP